MLADIAPGCYVEYFRAMGAAEGNTIVEVPELAAPVGFAHAVIAGPGRTVHLAGQIGCGPDGRVVGTTIVEQFDLAAANLLTALRAAGGSAADLVSLQLFVTDVEGYVAARRELGRVWQERFGRHYPAMGLFGVTRLFDPLALIELMGVAVLPRRHQSGLTR
jgi:enamine deaminase RidA (YjgF/YER057c/UK114 family)